jgi:neutral ceramidase
MEKPHFLAGAGKAEIRFPAGYFPQGEYDGQAGPLYVRCLLLRGGDPLLLISAELPSLRPWEITDALRAQAAGLAGVPLENAWLCMTHSLSAPHVPTPESGKREMHVQAVRAALCEAVAQARQNLQPARCGAETGLCGILANRDLESADGWWVGPGGAGASDPALTVLRWETPGGKRIASLYQCAVKSCVLEGSTLSDGRRLCSADLCGSASRRIEEETGAPALFFMGAAGDLMPRRVARSRYVDADGHFAETDLHEQGPALLGELAAALAAAVLAADAGIRCANAPALRVFQRDFSLAGQQSEPVPGPYRSYSWKSAAPRTLTVGAAVLGETVLLALRPELTVPIGALLAAGSPFARTLPLALANGGQGYLADEKEFERIEYEALHSEFARGEAERWAAAAAGWLRELAGARGVRAEPEIQEAE